MSKDHIRTSFEREDAARFSHLRKLRRCAALSKPWLLPPTDYRNSQEKYLPETYQSVVARGLTALEGQILVSLFPPSDPWFLQTQSDAITQDPNVDPEVYEDNERALLGRSLIATSKLESQPDDRNPLGFRTAKRQSISQVLALGDSLERLNDDYSLQTFSIANYTTCRDSSGSVLHHIVKEAADAHGLSDEDLSAAKLTREQFKDKYGKERILDTFTMVEWHPYTKRWVERREINGETVSEVEERVNRYFSTPFELAAGDNYGHGFVELHIGDIHSLDATSQRILEFAAAASKMYPVLDTGSDMEEEDLLRPSGSILRGRVQGGLVQDVAFVQTGKLADFQVVQATRDSLRAELGAAMLVGSQSVRDSERTTAFEVQQINIRELEGALGGFYAPIADRQQKPLVARLLHQCERDRVFMPIGIPDAVQVKILTGIDALARIEKMQRVLQFTQLVAQLGPDAIRHIDMSSLVRIFARYTRISEPGLIKSKAQLEQEAQAAMAQAAQAAAAQQAIQTTGAVVEQQAATQ